MEANKENAFYVDVFASNSECLNQNYDMIRNSVKNISFNKSDTIALERRLSGNKLVDCIGDV